MRNIIFAVLFLWVVASLDKIYGKDGHKRSWLWIFFVGIILGIILSILYFVFDISIGPNYE